MNILKENTATQRRCTKCKALKPLDTSHFAKDKNRSLGFMYKCKECEKNRKETRVWADRWKVMTDEQKDKSRAAKRKYGKTEAGRAISLLKAYQKFDASKNLDTDLTKYDILEARKNGCFYCSFPATGFDRKDNKKGHTKDNTVPCCKECNIIRMDNFSHEEMKVIGRAVAEIKNTRTNKQ